MKRKLLCILLSLAMVITMMPMTAMTAYAASGTAVSTFFALRSNLNAGTSVYLSSNITLTDTITIPSGKNVTLDLNGHTLTRDTTKTNAFEVKGTLTVINSSSTSGGITGKGIATSNTTDAGYGSIFYVNAGKLNLNTETSNGQIILQKNRHNCGGGVYVDKAGTLNMYDGVTIKECQAEGGGDNNYGGGVYVADNSIFNMNGGTIDGCIAQYGGGVFVHKSIFNMSDGTIQNCTCERGGTEREGGALYLYDQDASSGVTHKKSTLSGGFIQNNGKNNDCGGIYVNGLDLLITGTVTISGNASDSSDHTSTMYVKGYSKVTFEGGYFGPQGNGGVTMTYKGDGEDIKITSGKFFIGSPNEYYFKSGGNKTKIETGKQSCAITFDRNGGSGGTEYDSANYGETLPTITTPTWAGHKFLGYYDNFGEQYYGPTGAKQKKCDYVGEVTLTAQWELAPCTVTLNKNGGTGGTNSVTAYNGSAMPTEGVTMPTRTGYTFEGYFDTNAATGGNQYYKADGTSNQNWNKTTDAETLYARWTPNKYTITLDANGGVGGTDKVTATYDADMPTITMPSKPGYTNLGYYTSSTDGDKYYTGGGFGNKKWDKATDTTLYAHWDPNKYTIQYWSQDDRAAAKYDAAFVEEVKDVIYGNFTLASATTLGLTREHYDFIGWNMYRDQDWAMYQAGRKYSGGLTDTANGVATIYAAWKIKPQFTVVYNANGGENAPANDKVYRDDDYTISNSVPIRDGYTFTGWQADDGPYAKGATITNVQKDIILMALWQRNNSVGYHPNGGSYQVAPATLYPAKGSEVTVDFARVPVRDGYTFKGYATASDATTAAYTASGTKTFVMGNAGVMLYAVWGPISYNVSFSGCNGRYTFEGASPTNVDRDGEYTFKLKIDNNYDTDNLSVAVNGIVIQPAGIVSSDNYKVFTYTVKNVKAEQSVVISGIASTPQKINYELNGGTIAGEYATYYENGVGAALPASNKVTRTGYTFDGWFADEDFSGTAVTAVGVEENGEKIFYAKWKANSYTINYDANGGTAAPASATTLYDAIMSLATQGSMSYEGYSFLGWDENDNAVAPTYQAGDEVKNLTSVPNGTVKLYAIWNVEHHRVTFHINGGVMQDTFVLTDSVKHNGSITTPAENALKKTGNEFMGWATTEGSAVVAYEHNQSISVTDDLDLYAVWQAGNYTITYYNGETAVGDPQDMVFGTPAPLKDDTGLETPENKEFLGWSRSNTAAAAEFVGGQSVNAIGDGSAKQISLYAVWGDKTAKYLTYNANGGLWIGSVPDSVIDYGDGSVTLDAFDDTRLSRPGYTREGWLIGNTEYEDGVTIQITENTTVYANWIPNSYTVKFNANGGSGVTENKIMSYDVEAALTNNEFERTGYKFLGWARSSEGPLEFIDGQKVLNLTNANDAEITLYAVWEAIEPAWITYHANGGMSAPAAVSFAKNTTATVTNIVPALYGYKFDKWNTKADGSGTSYASGEGFTITENITLYAIWKAKTVYHVIYDLNGGVGLFVDPKSYFEGDTVSIRTEAEPHKSGNDFNGWKLSSDTTLRIGGTTTFTVTDTMNPEIVLTAQWKARKYKIDFAFGAREFAYDGKEKPVAVSAADEDGRVFTDYTVYYEGADYASSTNAPSGVGTYTVTAVLNDTDHYELIDANDNVATLKITTGNAVVWAFAGTQHKYDGSAKKITPASVPDLALNVTYYAVNDSGVIGNTVSTPTDLGNYLYVITLKDDDANKNYTIGNALSGDPAGKNISNLNGSNFGIMSIDKSIQPALNFDKLVVTKTYGDEPFTQTVKGGVADATITYSIPNEAERALASVDETTGKVTILKPGIVVVEAKAHKDGYTDTTASFAVIIEKRPVNIALIDSVMYNGKVQNAPCTVTNAVEGNLVSASDIMFTYQSTSPNNDPDVFKNVGTYYVTAAIPADNEYYTSDSTASRNVTITKASLIITADDKTVKYGDEAPEYTVSYTTLLGDDNEEDLSGSAIYTCTYAQFDDAGTYDISVEGLTSPNYDITFKKGTLTVDPLPVILSWSQDNLVYNGQEQKITATISNAVNGDTAKVCTYTGNAETFVGNYTAKATALDDTNYTLTSGTNLEKTWKISQKDVTVKPKTISIYVNGTAELKLDVSGLFEADRAYTGTPEFKLTKSDSGEISLEDAVKTAGTYTITWTNPEDVSFNSNYNVAKMTTATLSVKSPAIGGGFAVVTYNVIVEPAANGTVKTDKTTVAAGEDVKITATPDEGYVVDKILVNGKEVSDLTIKNVKEDITISVTFKKAEEIKDILKGVKIRANSKYLKYNGRYVTEVYTTVLEGKAELEELKKAGYTVKYDFYRSTSKKTGYKKMYTGKSGKYYNTKGVKGQMYYYRIVLKVYDSEGKLVAKTALNQCKYGNRTYRGYKY